MKALDKVFVQVIYRALLVINFIEAKKISYMKKGGKKTDKKDGIKLQSLRRKSTEFIKVKVNGTLNDVSKLQII